MWASDTGEQVLEASWWNGTASIQWVLTANVAPVGDPEFECTYPVCFGDSAVLSWSATGAESVVWMDSLSFPLDTVVQVALDSIAVEWQYGPQCVVDTTVLVDMPEALTLTLDFVNPLCSGGVAEVSFEASGGTPPLQVDWNGADPMALSDGVWPVVALDAAGCAVFDTVAVAAPPALEVDVNWSFQGDSDTVWVAGEVGAPSASRNKLDVSTISDANTVAKDRMSSSVMGDVPQARINERANGFFCSDLSGDLEPPPNTNILFTAFCNVVFISSSFIDRSGEYTESVSS